MNQTEAAQLLAYIAVFDNRNVTDMAAAAWGAALAKIPLDADTQQVVTEFYATPPKGPTGRRWMEPHHVIAGRSTLRATRLENFVYEPAGDEDPAAYLTRYREQRAAVASGAVPAPSVRPMLNGGPHPSVADVINGVAKTPEAAAAKDTLTALRKTPVGSMSTACPSCSATVGKHCKLPSGKPRSQPHPKRTEAAKATAAA